MLIDKLILNKELKERYKEYGLCEECKQPNTSHKWCQSCNSKRFQLQFTKWSSGNVNVDEFIQRTQIEWIEYNRFENIVYLAKRGFGTVYKVIKQFGKMEI
jgi:hypothetical protein